MGWCIELLSELTMIYVLMKPLHHVCGILVAVAIAIAPKLSLNTLLGGWLGLFVGAGCVTMSPVA